MILERVSLVIIKFYRDNLSSQFGGHCRFEPSCSEYARLAILKYGVIKGWSKTIKRIYFCRKPYGGVDYP